MSRVGERAGRSIGAVERDDARPAESQIVLQGNARPVDLAGPGHAAQLPGELRALGETGRADRMALGNQAAGGVDDPLAAVGGLPGVDELSAFALRAQAQRLDIAALDDKSQVAGGVIQGGAA